MRSFTATVWVNKHRKVMNFRSLREMYEYAKEKNPTLTYQTLFMRLQAPPKGLGWSVEQALRVKVNKYSRREVLREEAPRSDMEE